MTGLMAAVVTGVTAFCATNLDDILILLLFFSQIEAGFRHRHIVMGQYLGFTALVLVCLPSFFGGLLFPRPWIGLLGIVPIVIGVSRLLGGERDEDESEPETALAVTNSSPLSSLFSPQTYGVAAITFANGGDNIGIYVPLFANSSWESLFIILGEFFLLVGVWCYAAYQLTRLRAIANTLTRYGNFLVPFVLIGSGILILIDSHTLENRGLAVLSLLMSGCCLLMLLRNREENLKETPLEPSLITLQSSKVKKC